MVRNLMAVFVTDGPEMYNMSVGLYSITINITWSPPSVFNGELLHYNYCVMQQSDDAVTIAMRTTETFVSTTVRVIPYTNYVVSVSAVTGGGEGMKGSTSITSPEAGMTLFMGMWVAMETSRKIIIEIYLSDCLCIDFVYLSVCSTN